jgi:stage V sporulation protein R
MNYNLDTLQEWDEKICAIGKKYQLDWFDINYESIDYYEMIGAMAHHGMPSFYSHWSFGKAFERTHQMYNIGQEGLPYELIINSNPSIAYLMRENPLPLQILIMAHCVGHSDFFKNNRMFRNTRPEGVIQRFRSAKRRFQGYVEDPTISIDEVEKIIDACHAIQFQTTKHGLRKRSQLEIKEEKIEELRKAKYSRNNLLIDKLERDLDKVPLEPDYDILGFIVENAKLPDWKLDIIEVIREEGQYFWPQIQTKISNEGWACVTGETLVDTSEGLITAKELVEQRKGMVFDGNKYQNLIDWHYNPSTERVKIITNRGYTIHGSHKHRIWTGTEWKYIKDLNIGDEIDIVVGNNLWSKEYQKINQILKLKHNAKNLVKDFGVSLAQITRHRADIKTRANIENLEALSKIIDEEKDFSNYYLNVNKSIIFPEVICEKLANVLGMIIGDGGFWSRKDSNRIKSTFTTGDDQLKDLFVSEMTDLFNLSPRTKWDETRWRVDISSDIIVKWLARTFNFHVGNTAKIKFVPDQIMKSPKSVVASFIKGLFDTDGCASKNGNIIYVTTSPILAKQVHELLLKFGIISSLKLVKSNNENHNDCYRVLITGHSIKIFNEEIGFNLTRKQERVDNFIINKKWFSKVKNKVKVIAIEHDIGEVYDFTVENTHQYRASCFINHNSYNHYKICHELELPSELHLPIIKSHNQVIRPHIGAINPYHLGFHMFQHIEKKYGYEECLIARESCHDASFIRQYLDQELCQELNLFSYSKKKYEGITIDDISHDEGWEKVRNDLAKSVGGGSIPVVYVEEVQKNGDLIIHHEHDGRDLEIEHAKNVLRHIKSLWGNGAKLVAKINNDLIKID